MMNKVMLVREAKGHLKENTQEAEALRPPLWFHYEQ